MERPEWPTPAVHTKAAPICDSDATHSDLLGAMAMSEPWRRFLLAAVLSIMWYGFVGLLDRGLMVHQLPSITFPCLNEYLPSGTIHNPEGQPVQPGAEYVFVPLGLQCTYTMTDGSITQSFHPRYVQTVIAGLPLVLTLALVARSLRTSSKQRGKNE